MGAVRRRQATVLVAGAMALLVGCSSVGTRQPAGSATSVPAGSATSVPTGSATSVPTGSPASASAPAASAPAVDLPPVTDPVSLPALMRKAYDGRSLTPRRVLARTDSYTRWFVTYRSEGLRISGVMNVPKGTGPFPVLVLLHGYIDPEVYVNGQGLAREQDYLARRGYVALHIDYRDHAQSDDGPRTDEHLRLGYTVDTINAVQAVRRSRLPYLDGNRVGLLGRSMGGGVTYNTLVVAPGLVDAAVVFAPVSSDAVDNFDRFLRGDPSRRALSDRIIAAHGSPAAKPEFWAGVSPRGYFDRITEPVLIHHGTSDDTCPPSWSRTTARAMKAAGVDVQLRWYRGEEHAFVPQWPLSMRRTLAFFDRTLGV